MIPKEKTTHVILEFDRDYRTVTRTLFMNFNSDEEANKYALEQSWTGYKYYAYRWETIINNDT